MHLMNHRKGSTYLKLFTSIAATTIATFVLTAQVMADTKIVQSVQVQNAQIEAMLKKMPPAQQAAMKKQGIGAPVNSTLYIKGQKVRMDNPMMSIIQDYSSHKMIMLNNASKSYMTHDFNPNQAQMNGMKVSVSDLHQTKVILGHPAHHFKSTVSFNNQNMNADIWAATDMPMPAALATNYAQFGAMSKEFKKISGMPVLVNASMPTPQGQVKITMKMVSITTNTVPASLFQIPAGYTKAPEGAGLGGRMPGMQH